MRRIDRVLIPLAVLTALFGCSDSSAPKPIDPGQYVYTVYQEGQHVTQTGTLSVTEIQDPNVGTGGVYYQYSFALGDSLRVNATIVGQHLPDTVSRYGFNNVCQPSPSACFSLHPWFVQTSPTVIVVPDNARSSLVLTPVSSTEIDGTFDIVAVGNSAPTDSLAGIHGQFRAELSGH